MIVAIIRALIDCAVYRFFDKPFPVERRIGGKININEAHKHRRAVIGAHPQRGDTVFLHKRVFGGQIASRTSGATSRPGADQAPPAPIHPPKNPSP